jgi:hypothetical protein
VAREWYRRQKLRQKQKRLMYAESETQFFEERVE